MEQSRDAAKDQRDAAREQRDAWRAVSERIEDVRIEQERTSGAVSALGDRVGRLERTLGDVTQVGIKTGRHADEASRQRPSLPAARRDSLWPPPKWAVGLGLGVVLAIGLMIYFIGAFVATGDAGKAGQAVHTLVAPASNAVQHRTGASSSPEPADSSAAQRGE